MLAEDRHVGLGDVKLLELLEVLYVWAHGEEVRVVVWGAYANDLGLDVYVAEG